MANPNPLSFLESLIDPSRLPQPPVWLLEEMQRRVVLLINHVLMQEPQAMQRLVRHQGRVIRIQWRQWTFTVQISPAGLFELVDVPAPSDLSLAVSEESPWLLAQTALRGEKPPVRIEGDVQLAAEVNWLVDNVRWDVAEDLSRVIGDVPAHLLVQTVQTVAGALRSFLSATVAGRARTSGDPA